MTKAEAAELQAKWKLREDGSPCTHSSKQLEHTEGGYLTGSYHCVDCGESFASSSQH